MSASMEIASVAGRRIRYVEAGLIVGKEDVLTTPTEMERMASAIAGVRFFPLEGAGHLSNLETPEAFNRGVNECLQTIPEA